MSAAAAMTLRGDRAGIRHWFPGLDDLLKGAVQRAREVYSQSEENQEFRGLYISEQQIDALMHPAESGTPFRAPAEFLERCATLPGIESLSEHFGLTPFDHAVLILALGPEVDLRYERIYAYLQDDVTRRKPTVDLALNLFSAGPAERMENRMRFAPSAPLLRSGLLRLLADPAHPEPPLLSRYLDPDESAVRSLLGEDGLDSRLAGFCSVEKCDDSPGPPSDLQVRLTHFARVAGSQGRPLRLQFAGPSATAKTTAAKEFARSMQRPLLTADLARIPVTRIDVSASGAWIAREALRMEAVVYLQGLDGITEPAQRNALLDEFAGYEGPVIVAGESAGAPFLTIHFPLPEYDARRTCWQAHISSAGLYADADTVATLANRFLYAAEQVAAAVNTARQNLDWRTTATQRPSPDEVAEELMRAAREQSGNELQALTARLRPVYRWDDIVLPNDLRDQLNEICQRVAYSQDVLEMGGFGQKLSSGKGVAVLFAGPSGTGKTMAAEVIANKLGIDLYRIDLSTVVSKYIGETEKNLERIFAAAARSNSVLLFDEADALCGKRSEIKDAHDRYANIEISYLLQKMEQYEGITILTTNLRGNLDEAFTRRLAFTVHFPFPDEGARLSIWRRMWPAQTKFDSDVDFPTLAKHFKLSGGSIKNIALTTAFLAAAEGRPVRMTDLLHATRREYEKAGKVLSTAELSAAVR